MDMSWCRAPVTAPTEQANIDANREVLPAANP
jgi:hypothetical protein